MSRLDYIVNAAESYLSKKFPQAFKVQTLDYGGFKQTFFVMNKDRDPEFDGLYFQLSHLGLQDFRIKTYKKIAESSYESIIVSNKVPLALERSQKTIKVHSGPTFNFEVHDYESMPDVSSAHPYSLEIVKNTHDAVDIYSNFRKPNSYKKGKNPEKIKSLDDFDFFECNNGKRNGRYYIKPQKKTSPRKLRIDVLHSVDFNGNKYKLYTELKRDSVTAPASIKERALQISATWAYLIYKHHCTKKLDRFVLSYSTPFPICPVEGNGITEHLESLDEPKPQEIFFWNLSSETGLESMIALKKKNLISSIRGVKNNPKNLDWINENQEETLARLQEYYDYLSFVESEVL